ncbi:hypothetical protein BS47DRAFT_825475 [Hydnum rufescens UP504]|uniref:Uncharacterized protein n=1 Tax=Hydnum rufescens UP504 TaxID=1448309 RepID=A0A9P6B064_9AGAM|nr:hypothetical protein BS47DRAFT_825475 [Hydnum rufescens UP504]
MDDSDLENIPPLVVRQVSTELDDDDSANGARAPLKALSSFSSSLSLSSISRVSGKPLGVLAQGEKRHLSSASRSRPLAELRDSAWQPDENVGETDFGFGGMSQLFEATQGMQSQNDLLRDGPVRGAEFSLSLSTQASGLLPAVKISDSRRRMNDNILIQQEEDIGLTMREQASSPSNDRKRLFLNEDGGKRSQATT